MRAAVLKASRTNDASRFTKPSLYEFIPTLGPDREPPRHLDPLVRALERAWYEPIRQTAHAPPRHAKTDTVLAFIVLTLLLHPDWLIGYVSYSASFARRSSRRARVWARQAGVRISEDNNRSDDWRTPEGGGLLSTGIGGPLTGHGVRILLVDDPYKNRQQAESHAYQEMVADWWGDVGNTRIDRGGSVFIFHTRWVTDDLINLVLTHNKGARWEPHIRLPAINDNGEPLWPSRWPLEDLLAIKAENEYTWASLYQGLPRPRGASVFHDPYRYDVAPREGVRIVIGVDLAYTRKTQADYSTAVVLGKAGDRYYVLHVERLQVEAPAFKRSLTALQLRYGRAQIFAYVGGTEKGIIQLLARSSEDGRGILINTRPAQADKFVRAQPVAAAWNAGRVLVPHEARWLADFERELTSFTGVNDEHDDQVDALAAAFDALSMRSAPYSRPAIELPKRAI